MTSVMIVPMPTGQGSVTYCAASNGKRSQGATAGEALDALTAQMPKADANTLVIVQDRQPDQYFTAEQQDRLGELLAQLRTARAQGKPLAVKEESELDALIDAELRGATDRAAALISESKR